QMWNSPEYQAFRASVNTESMCAACRNCYQASAANWNRRISFDQRGQTFAPEWEG
ncbi:MAG: radical SAM protein, partial [Oscillibacter sp.]|nr:radical SAM protein [Oscillibacter sp.]